VSAHHHHGHSHSHSHGVRADTDGRRLAIALALIVGLLVGELIAAAISHSLALLSDAAHMLTDAGALGLSLVAARLARRPAKGAMTYGLGRAEILSAQANGVTLVVLGGLILFEGIRRVVDPPEVAGTLVLVLGLAGALVNLAAVRVLSGANRDSLNVEGAFRHLLTDLFAFLATAAAGAVVLLTGFDRADAIASGVVAVVMLVSGWGLVKASGRVFLEAAPEGLDPSAIGNALAGQPGVVEIHDLHVWEVTSGFAALSAHVVVGADRDCHEARHDLEALLDERFGLHHTTLQVDHQHLIEIEDSLYASESRLPEK
jgi:cobalt-zinc-cadmium efflux system protein